MDEIDSGRSGQLMGAVTGPLLGWALDGDPAPPHRRLNGERCMVGMLVTQEEQRHPDDDHGEADHCQRRQLQEPRSADQQQADRPHHAADRSRETPGRAGHVSSLADRRTGS